MKRWLDWTVGLPLWLALTPGALWWLARGHKLAPPREVLGLDGRELSLPCAPPQAPSGLCHWLDLGQVLLGNLSLVGPRPRPRDAQPAEVLLKVAPGWLSPARWAPPQASERLRLRLETLYARDPQLHDDLAILWQAWCHR